MEDIQEQLAALRRRVAGIDRKYAGADSGGVPGPAGTPPGTTPGRSTTRARQRLVGKRPMQAQRMLIGIMICT